MQHLPINQAKVKALVKQCKHLNVFPIYLPRYFYSDENHPVSTLLIDLVQECVQYLSIMTDDEVRSLVLSLPPGIRMMLGNRGSEANNTSVSERIALYYLVAVTYEHYLSFKQIISNRLDESEVLKVYPELRTKIDDDGLLHLDNSFALFDGGIEYKNHILHYHQFLRRVYTSNPNFDFLSKFIRCYSQTKSINRFRIAIDHQRLMPKELFERILEMDTWFGPLFDKARLDDPNAVGLTVIKRIKPSIFDLSHKLERTEFYWSFRDGVKTFEVEELSSDGTMFDAYYLNKYVHTERDIQQQVLRHCDGAVKVYLQDSYSNRLTSQMPTELKSHKKIKLWRIDGDIDVEAWIEMLALFYKGNEMLIEYFNPDQFEQEFGERIRAYKDLE